MSEKTGLELMREPFKAHQISKLPKPTKAQTAAVKNDFKAGARCRMCGAWHHPDVVHLDYVGHAALTDRLLDCDPNWNWEPVGVDEKGRPLLDADGGMWIRLTVCGVTRLGYGDAGGKDGADATKERIGDALRNAAMRFGAALDLWHKGALHVITDEVEARRRIADCETLDGLRSLFDSFTPEIKESLKGLATERSEEIKKLATPSRKKYSQEGFEANFPQWKELIESGKKTAEQIINTVRTKADMTNEQVKAIRDCEISEGSTRNENA